MPRVRAFSCRQSNRLTTVLANYRRHQQAFYAFIRAVAQNDSAVEDMLSWLAASNDRLSELFERPVDLQDLLPSDETALQALMDELKEVVAYHERKRQRQYERACKRYAGEVDGDDPIVVQGDSYGNARTEPIKEPSLRKPFVIEIGKCLERFRSSLTSLFA